MSSSRCSGWLVAATFVAAVPGTRTVGEETQGHSIELRDYLVLPAVGNYGRLPVHQDAVESLIVSGTWRPPTAGDIFTSNTGEQKKWRAAAANDGTLDTSTLRGGYACASFDAPAEQVMLLEAAGHAAVYVNSELHTGDPYRLGWLKLPVVVRQGKNTLLFHVAADSLSARLVGPPRDVYFMDADRTVPTLVRGEREPVWAGAPIVNATREWLRDLHCECGPADGDQLTTPVAPIAPLSVRKIAIQLPASSEASATEAAYVVRLVAGSEPKRLVAETRLEAKIVGPSDVQVRTFRSRIDQSVQPYAVRPATAGGISPGMIVTLHDAGVDCAEQAAQFAARDWAHVVAPQGRRPHGFDWEDWGRIDALEAMADAAKHYPSDPRRTFLTGNGMGGHGGWHLGVIYPDRFAAVGASGGWASFWSYGGGMPTFQNPTRLQSLMLRGFLPSDTTQLLSNLADMGVFVLHSTDDATVPVAQARFVRGRLAGFHTNFAYLENQEEDLLTSREGVDSLPMMEFFERQSRPAAASRTAIDFATADPGISSRCYWATIATQQEPFKLSRVALRQDLATRTFVGQTSNVARMAVDVGHLPPSQPVDVSLDGQQLQLLAWPEDGHVLWFEQRESKWQNIGPPSPRVKNPARNGSFKSAFDHNALLVYGTGGTAEEDRWAEDKARYDAETFWYRGGGALELMPDTAFKAAETIGRSVILYGNADMNSAWQGLLADCPVQLQRERLRVGERTETSDELAVLAIYPRADSDGATVAVVGGTGPVGMGLTNRLRYFVSGIAYPDWMIIDPRGLSEGSSAIRGWGYFGPDWALDSTASAWRDAP